MTSLETTIEAPQITSLADVPTEFWIAMCLQFFILVFGIWAVAKIMKFLIISVPARVARKFSSDEKIAPAADTIDDDFADIAEEMRKERGHE